MLGLMQEWPLLCHKIIDHAGIQHPNREIVKVLNISLKTVETHRSAVLRKLKIETTAGLVRYAVRNKLVEAEWLRQINPSGKISLSPSGKSSLRLTPSCPRGRGVGHRHRTLGWDAVDAAASCAEWDCRAG